MLELKNYQKSTLTALNRFLLDCRTKPINTAYEAALAAQNRFGESYHDTFGNVPCVCLRVPTGGGKTILAAHSISLAGKAMLDSDAPVALWLTSSDPIRTQTLEALSNVRHPYRQALAEYFGDRVQVCDLENLQTISPHEVGKSCVVVIATIQSFNVSDTGKRNVYAFFEELAPHFDTLPPQLQAGLEKVSDADLANQPYLTSKDIGRTKYSVANWLHLQRPLVIVDEAHNNKTDRFFRTLGRINPSCIIELTATPIASNNVLYHVSAQELKAEQMIKLPIVLAEHPEGWRQCLQDAILTRKRLESVAQNEAEYIRPIMLIQAENVTGEATVEAVRQYLIEQENVPEPQIAVATGSQKELSGIDLFDPACPIRYVITVEALKEGWDCPFAYVLASLQSVGSAKDVEQLLGRVLRMPYAKSRQNESLNRAYAHIVASNFAEAASKLKDRMVQNMGFDRFEANLALQPMQQSLLENTDTGTQAHTLPPIPDCHITLSEAPDISHWTDEVKQNVEIRHTTQGVTVLLKGDLDHEILKQAEGFIANSVPEREREGIKQQFDMHRAIRQAVRAPAQLGITFALIPQLCLSLDGAMEVVEKETLSSLGDWNLLESQVKLEGFSITETVSSFEIDVNGEKMTYRLADVQQLQLNDMPSHISEQDFTSWLERQTRKPYIMPTQLRAYLVKMLSHLIHERGFTLTQLIRAKFQLVQALNREIERLRKQAIEKGFQGRLFEMCVPSREQMEHFSFQFRPGIYPSRQNYMGSYEFGKHFYPTIHDLREKTSSGRTSEEFQCAMVIDAHPMVKHWVRNIERQEKFSFWLPTSTDYFYPDFIAELTDGRLLAVEYKGEPYETNDDSREKKQVGHQWEQASNGRCLFLFAVKDDNGRSLSQQVDDKIRNHQL